MFVTGNGIQLYFTDTGSGLPLVVHHGGPGFDHTTIAPFLSGLSHFVRLICFDHRGTGRSSRPQSPKDYTLDHFVLDLEGLRQSLGLPTIALLGHSFGGIVAQHYALAYPERLSHLVLVCTAPSHDFLKEAAASLRISVSRAIWSELEEIGQQAPSAENMKRAFMLQAPIFFHDPAQISALELEQLCWGPESQLAWPHIATFDLRDRLSAIRAPTIIITGKSDAAISPTYSAEMARLIPGAHLVMMEDCAHFPFIEDNQSFISILSQFLLHNPRGQPP
jgi:proline iminopeptidase